MTLRELIAQHASDLGDDYPAIAARLNAPTSAENPVKDAPKIPRPLSLEDVIGIVPAAAVIMEAAHG